MMRPDHGRITGSCGVLPVTTDQMASSHVPSADQYPRRGDRRKGAYRRRTRWRQRHPCPRHHDERSGPDKGTGQEQGRAGKNFVPSACLRGRQLRSFTANHGQSKLLLNGSIRPKSCSSQAFNQRRLRRALAPGWSLG
jgi:hypothetical protein